MVRAFRANVSRDFHRLFFHFAGLSAVGAAFSYHSLDDAGGQTMDAATSVATGSYPRRHNATATGATACKQTKITNAHHLGQFMTTVWSLLSLTVTARKGGEGVLLVAMVMID